ncbi:hypothetical protein [Quisquiliibacterium transsilvanicum]|uniref:Uncharacterized protein n=1 Tax=Quisquiliibacterium transsilvanicum TaxID=1549638 RepID=A0A7W8HG24_9BURK|nr:hypothetical protein [Quisquiliibacterium transsilvanicum]MBB5271325.1 hypothetical protein [Quisquiliibacterium transsilvanicum]
MAMIDLRNFGGEMPSASARALPANAARTNKNLLLATNEFRPLAQDTNTAVAAAGAKSIYRMNTGTWKVSASDINYVKGQIADDDTERTYLTFNDGSAPPRVFDKDGADRQLGVPPPATAPALVHNVVDELRISELPEAATQAASLIESTIRAQLTYPMLGGIALDPPTSTSYGWLPHPTDQTNTLLLTPMTAGALPVGYEFLLDPLLNGVEVTYSGLQFWQIEVNSLAVGRAVNEAALATALEAVDDPVRPGEKLLTPTEAAFAADEAHRYLDATQEPQAAMLESIWRAAWKVDGVMRTVRDGTMTAAFFAGDVYQRALWQLGGNASSGEEGAVTARVMDLLYIVVANTAYGTPTNINAEDDPAAWVANYDTAGTPLGWWEPNIPAGSFSRSEGIGKIRTALYAAVKTGVDGVPYLDREEFRDKALGELNDLVNRRPSAESRSYYAPLVVQWLDEALVQLEAFFAAENLRRLALGLTGSSTSVAFARAVDDLRVATDTLTAHYAILGDSLATLARNVVGHYSVAVAGRHAEVAVSPVIEARFYVYTYVTDWGEESAMSPVSTMLEVDQNDTVGVTMAAAPSGRNVAKWRLYRSATGSTSSAFLFVAEGAVTGLTYTDSVAGAALGEPCPSGAWLQPPAKLGGLVGMPNGIMAGFFGSTVAFCEPYVPYAWPAEYWVALEHPVVGLGVFGQTLFVGTTGNPYFISGADSASMSAVKLDSPQSCASRRSIATVQGGVLYASPDGLCVATPNGVELVSTGLFTREDWQKLTPSTMVAAQHEGIYYLFYAGSGGGCLTFDLTARKLGRIDLIATATHSDLLTDTLYVAHSGTIHSVATAATRRTGEYQTGKMTFERHVPMAWLKVYGDQTPEAPVTVQWYGEGVLRHTATVADTSPQRLPAGRWLEHEVHIASKARVTRLVMAGNTEELQAL